MTDDRSPIDDELVSAVLDGEATAQERALVEGSAEGRRRLAELRAVAEVVAAPPAPLDPGTIDAMVGRALDAAQPAPAPVDEVAARRARRSAASARWRQGLAVAAAAVAAVVLVGGLAVLAGRSGTSSSSDSAASSGETVSDQDDAGAGASADSGRDAEESLADASGVPADLGAFADGTAALDAWRARVVGDPAMTARVQADAAMPTSSFLTGAGACAVPPIAPLPGESWAIVAAVTLPSGPAVVVADIAALPDGRAVVVDPSTCAVLAGDGP
jgi:hypothetical protein